MRRLIHGVSRRPLVGPSWIYESSQATTSGTEVDFSVGPDAEDVIMSLRGVSWGGAQKPIIQISDGSFKTSGYNGGGANFAASSSGASNEAEGFPITNAANAAYVFDGFLWLTLSDPDTNLWSLSTTLSVNGGGTFATVAGGTAALSGALQAVRLTSKSSPSAFDLGTAYLKWRARIK